MSDVIEDAEVVEPGQDIEVRSSQPVGLFGTTDPGEVISRAAEHATALAAVIKNKNLFTNIQGKNHVQVEGWQLLGAMTGVFAVVTETKPITDSSGAAGWEARCEARTMNGQVIGAADAQCTRSERMWKTREDYALRSMAQTRATSKALKGPLGFIVELAGYSATPAEEMTFAQQSGSGTIASEPSAAKTAPPAAETVAPSQGGSAPGETAGASDPASSTEAQITLRDYCDDGNDKSRLNALKAKSMKVILAKQLNLTELLPKGIGGLPDILGLPAEVLEAIAQDVRAAA